MISKKDSTHCIQRTMINAQLFIRCSGTIHTRNPQYLATEIFKVKIDIPNAIMTKIFKFSDNATAWKVPKYGVFSGPYFPVFSPNAGKYRPEKNFVFKHSSRSVLIINPTLGAKVWALFLENLRQSMSLYNFKESIKKWNPSKCPWLCKTYVLEEPQAYNFIKKRLAQVFSCKFCEISKNTFFTEHLWATTSVTYKKLVSSWRYYNKQG